MSNKEGNPKSFIKKKVGNQLGFKAPSRFSGGGAVNANVGTKSQYKPIPTRITQHKG